MKRYELVTYPNDVLRTLCKRISLFDNATRDLAQQMLDIMMKNGGIGIAAPQVGVTKRLIICWTGDYRLKPIILCNPTLVKTSKETQTAVEGCLSIPDTQVEKTRCEEITVKYQDLHGRVQSLTCKGVLSRCVQHEMDHLNGMLMID